MNSKAADFSIVISDIIGRDQVAFNQLYNLTSRNIFRFLLRVLKNRADAEEVLQDVYMKIWKYAERYPQFSNPLPLLTTIAKHQAIDMIRRRSLQTEYPDTLEHVRDKSPDPETVIIDQQKNVTVSASIARLDNLSAALVRSAYLDGCSYKELSDIHGNTLNTVRTILRRGLLKMKNHYVQERAYQLMA